jgi:unsaturated rhamnogalacturonyl hydrolase
MGRPGVIITVMRDFPPRHPAPRDASSAHPAAVWDALSKVTARTRDWQFFCWYWGDAIAIDGMLAAAATLGAPEPRDFVAETLDRWASRCPPTLDDALAPGAAIASLAGDGTLSQAAAGRFLAAIERLPRLDGGVPALEPHRPAYRFGVCIDALYHLPSGLAAMGRLRDAPELAREAVDIAVKILELTRCPAGWAQWYDAARHRNNAVAWSRGLGWALLGCLDTLALAAGLCPVTALLDVTAELFGTLLTSQQADGHWPTVLGHGSAPSETSTAAFFTAAALHPQAPVSVPAGAVSRSLHACLAAVDQDGTCRGVSADVLPSWEPDDYLSFGVEPSPWGQGSALRALAAAAGPGPPGPWPPGGEPPGGEPPGGEPPG